MELMGGFAAYGAWMIPASLLDADTVAYCVDCDVDVSFDLALNERFGYHAHGFDPTPRSIAFVGGLDCDSRYHFRPEGVWSKDTTLTFYLNDNPEHISGSLVGLNGRRDSVEVEVRSLRTLMDERSHTRIDLLKLDAEGAEYETLDDMIEGGVQPRCLCVEFDQPTPVRKTYAMVRKLQKSGYGLISVRTWDFVFVPSAEINPRIPSKKRESNFRDSAEKSAEAFTKTANNLGELRAFKNLLDAAEGILKLRGLR